jgi:hypothetical protein
MTKVIETNKDFGFLIFVAILSFIFSMVSLWTVWFSTRIFFSDISGRVSNGELNLTVEILNEVNFSVRAISWGSGRVDQEVTAASLTTSNFTGIPNVTGGNWTLDDNPGIAGFQSTGGMRIENIGNVNVTINFTVAYNASIWIGGTNPITEWNLSVLEANSCLNVTATLNSNNVPNMLFEYYEANTTPVGRLGCSVFPFESARDTLRLDFNITVPENSLTGARGNVITAVASAI